MDGVNVHVVLYTMEDCLRASVDIYMEVFPKAFSLASASSSTASTPCYPETHDRAPVALPNSEVHNLDQSGGGPTEVVAKEFHVAAARVIMMVMYAANMASLRASTHSRPHGQVSY